MFFLYIYIVFMYYIFIMFSCFIILFIYIYIFIYIYMYMLFLLDRAVHIHVHAPAIFGSFCLAKQNVEPCALITSTRTAKVRCWLRHLGFGRVITWFPWLIQIDARYFSPKRKCTTRTRFCTNGLFLYN